MVLLSLSTSILFGIFAACGTEESSEFPNGDGLHDGGELDAVDERGFAGDETGVSCSSGTACGDGGVCAGDTCCPATQACDDRCCGAGEVCSFKTCVAPGAVCHDVSDCGGGEYCEFSLGETRPGGVLDAGCVATNLRTGRCLPRPPECAPDAGGAGAGVTCLERCEYRPAVSSFALEPKFAWGGQTTSPTATDVMMAPIVIQLDDDDCDGKVTERDIPEILVTTFASGKYNDGGVLRALSIVQGQFVEKWRIPNDGNPSVVQAAKQIAAGNFDGAPGNEVVACGQDGFVYAFRGDGSLLWKSTTELTCFMPHLADLDGDGAVEVVVEGAILNGVNGTVQYAFTPTLNGPFVVSDIDGDGKLDVVTASRGYRADGTLLVDTGRLSTPASFVNTPSWKGPWAGIGDFDLDGKPEIVAVDNMNHTLFVWRYDASETDKFAIVRESVDMNAQFTTVSCPVDKWGATHGGGPPTVADFDRDGVPDVGLAGGIGYVVFNGKKLVDAAIAGADTIMWSQPTTDCSSASTGSTVFDFNGDGKAEVVYSDEHRLRIYEGATGAVLASVCNTTSTLVEFPVVADVDNDGQADIVVVSNAYDEALTCDDEGTATRQSGVRVFGDRNGSWVRTRRVWNEHAYHITNVEEDGTIPRSEAPNWKQPGLNNFRQNKQPGSEFAAPNLIASVTAICPGPDRVAVRVQNVGQASAPKGVPIGVYAGAAPGGARFATAATGHVLYPGESEVFEFPTPTPRPSSVYAVVDDAPTRSLLECRTDDNVSPPAELRCNRPR